MGGLAPAICSDSTPELVLRDGRKLDFGGVHESSYGPDFQDFNGLRIHYPNDRVGGTDGPRPFAPVVPALGTLLQHDEQSNVLEARYVGSL